MLEFILILTLSLSSSQEMVMWRLSGTAEPRMIFSSLMLKWEAIEQMVALVAVAVRPRIH